MASSALHFAVGLAVGAAIFLPRLARRWPTAARLAPVLSAWIVTAGMLGAWAVIPDVAQRAGAPPEVVHAWWMNLFLGFPLIDRLAPHHTNILGVMALLAGLAGQYIVLLAAIVRARRSRQPL